MSITPGMTPDVDGVENDFRQQSHVQRFEHSADVLSRKRFSKERRREHTSPLYGSPATTLDGSCRNRIDALRLGKPLLYA